MNKVDVIRIDTKVHDFVRVFVMRYSKWRKLNDSSFSEIDKVSQLCVRFNIDGIQCV